MNTYLICSDKPWNANLTDELNKIFKEKETFLKVSIKIEDAYPNRYKPKKLLFPHYNHMIPEGIYKNYECIIFHTGNFKGGSPVQHMITKGHKEAVIRAIRAVKEVDAGGVYTKRRVSLEGNIEEIFMRINEKIKEMIVQIIKQDLKPKEKNTLKTVLKRRKPHENCIKELKNLDEVNDYIRMLDSDNYPRAFLETDNLRLEFSNANRKVGKIEANVIIKEK